MIRYRESSILALQNAKPEKERLRENVQTLQKRNTDLETQTTDLQLALCELYEGAVE